MSKNKNGARNAATDAAAFCPSTFYLTFVVEIVGIDIFHDCNEGRLDLEFGPAQGMRLGYILAPGYAFDIDIVIWPHIAKVWCGANSGWVRTWYFLQRRWLAFSIRHSLPVRIEDFRSHFVTINPTYGLGTLSTIAKSDKVTEVFLPKPTFGQSRQFAPVLETEEDTGPFIPELIWSLVVNHIPTTYADGPFDTPQAVLDKRHQDAVLQYVQETILNRTSTNLPKESQMALKSKFDLKSKDNKKTKGPDAVKYEIYLSGDEIICGTGRIIPFRAAGVPTPDVGEIIVLIGSANLPAQDDNPAVFVNVGKLTDVPVKELKKHNIQQIYTKWKIADDEHCSEPRFVTDSTEIDFEDHHAVPLNFKDAAEIVSTFRESRYRIEIRGIRPMPSMVGTPTFFGYAKGDRDFATAKPPKQPNLDTDILLAITKIDLRQLTKGINAFDRGEYPVYPPEVCVKPLEREIICTNDINAVRSPMIPELVVPTSVILEAQMTLEVSVGVIGCRPYKMPKIYSRLYALVSDSTAVMTILRVITEINEQLMENGENDSLLTGFALDTGDTVMLYVEGPRDEQILRVWEVSEDFYPDMKPIFSTSSKYQTRLYSEMLLAAMPFNILKMFVPLPVVLACPPVYVRPALPLPTRIAVLKIGRLLTSKLIHTPTADEMPTMAELKSFRLELCVAPRPPPVVMPTPNATPVKLAPNVDSMLMRGQSSQRINWETKPNKKDN